MKRVRRFDRIETSRRPQSGFLWVLALGLVIAALIPAEVRAAEETLWQIGKPDNASLEFNRHWEFSKAGDPRFVVGKSNPEKDWSAFHPGVNESAAGDRSHPFTILFDLSTEPRGVFYLTIDAMFTSPGIPEYAIEVNGKKGRFYFEPKLSSEMGDPDTAWNIMYSVQRLHIPLPAGYFQKGENRIVLTCGDDAARVILPETKTPNKTSGIYYDALELSQNADGKFDATPPPPVAAPTIFYRRHDNNKLSEVVLLKAATARRNENASARLQVGKETFSCRLSSDYDFGESECAVEVPELGSATPAKLVVFTGGKSVSAAVSLVPQKKWKLYLCPLIHLDMGYTDYRPNSYEVHNRNIDQVIARMESDPDYKFNPDGSFIFDDYWAHRSQAWRERCLKVLKDGRLALPAQLFTINTGLASQEELHRLAYSSARFSREYKIPLLYADQTDVPAHSWAVPSILGNMGVKYFAISSNAFRGPILLHGHLNERSPFWWEGPDGNKVLTWFSRPYLQLEQLFTPLPNVPAGLNSLPLFLQTYTSPSYTADAVMLYGTQSDNRPFAPEEAGFPEQWNKEFAYPVITTATMIDFFEYMERNFAPSFATFKGDGGAWWEEMAASDALYAGITRKVKERALAADALASISSIVNPDFRFPREEDQSIWNNLLLYTEHTWGYPSAWSHPESDPAKILLRDKESFTRQAEIGTDHLLNRGLSQLTAQIYTKGETVAVFNSLSWARGGLVEVELNRGQGLIDVKTRQAVPLELIRNVEDESYARVRFWADEVPPLGYRCYEVTPSGSATKASDLPISNVVENAFYKVIIDPSRGGISSVFDKQMGQELVDAGSPYALNQYVYAGYGHEGVSLIQQKNRFNTTLLQYSTALPHPQLEVSAAEKGKVIAARKTPWGTTLLLQSSAAHTPLIETEVRLFDQSKRIELVNTINKDVVRAPEGVYIAFPFVGRQPVIQYEIQNAWVDPRQDQLPGANKEWFSGQHWVAVTNPGLSMALAYNEAPLLTIGDINRGLWPTTLDPVNGTVFSYIMDNYDGDDERPFQGGAFTFHYVLSSSTDFNPSRLARFGREATSPLEVKKITAADKYGSPPGPLGTSPTGFINIDSQDVILSIWKGAEDGDGYILRFYNTTERPVTTRVQFPGMEFGTVYHVNAVEVNEEQLAVQKTDIPLALKPHEIYSLRISGFRLD